jgi:hypothetical protein
MKKNILIIGFNHYSVINFFKRLFIINKNNLNFYIITSNGDQKYEKIFEELKSEKIIKNYFFTDINKSNNLRFYREIKLLNSIKKINEELKKIQFDRIICSDFTHIEVKYLIENVKKINPQTIIIGFNLNSFKISEKIINSNFFCLRDIYAIRTISRKIKFLSFHFMKNIILSLIYFKKINKDFIRNYSYPLFYNEMDYIISNKPFEIHQYKKKFNNIKIFFLNCSHELPINIVNKKSLLVLLDIVKNSESNQFLIKEYEMCIQLLVDKLNIDKVYLKPHPRDFTDNLVAVKKNIRNCDFQTVPKELEVSSIICEHEYILGAGSAVMNDALNCCSNTKVFGMLNLGNKICRDPSVKVLLGDAYGFKSGIVWIEEHNYFKTMSCDEIIKLATNQKRDRTISKEKQIIYKNFFN